MPNSVDTQRCCHCGQLHSNGLSFSVVVGGVAQPMCCPGCQAAASLVQHCSELNKQYKRYRL